jgi:hypothetical protein
MELNGRTKLLLWTTFWDVIGVALIVLAFFVLNDGSEPTILGIFGNVYQLILAVVGVLIMVASALWLLIRISRA